MRRDHLAVLRDHEGGKQVSEDVRPEEETTEDGINVFWEPAHYSPEDIEAELPDVTRVQAVLVLGGRRLGFDRRLP